MTDRPDTDRETAAWDEFEPPDSTQDRITNTSSPTGPAPQRAPSRDDDEAGQSFGQQPQWEPERSSRLRGATIRATAAGR